MNYETLEVRTNGERFYDLTSEIEGVLERKLLNGVKNSGMLHIVVTHTSCALTVNEAYEPSAAIDMQNFLKHLAPRDLSFITHTTEGSDDSPSHMKTMLLQNSLSMIVDNGQIVMGSWQGIYLAEFRDAPRTRRLMLKYQADA